MENQTPCIVSVNDQVMTLKLNRPEDGNRITTKSMNLISEAIDSANLDPDIKCILITGDKNNFCCGGRFDPNCTQEEKDAYTTAISTMQEKLLNAKAPVIAAVEGNCIAGGNDLLACADIAIAREGVKFGFPEITYGGFPVMVMINIMDLIPKKKLLPYFYTGELFEAKEASEYGMVTAVASDENFWPAVQKYIDALKIQPLATLSIGRRAYLGMLPLTIEERRTFGTEILQSVRKEQAASGKKY